MEKNLRQILFAQSISSAFQCSVHLSIYVYIYIYMQDTDEINRQLKEMVA